MMKMQVFPLNKWFNEICPKVTELLEELLGCALICSSCYS